MKPVSIALISVTLLVLLALNPDLAASAQSATPTMTYTPIPTRTPLAATQAVIVVTSIPGAVLQVDRTVSYGDVFVVVAVAAVFALLALWWAYQWVRSHIRTQEAG